MRVLVVDDEKRLALSIRVELELTAREFSLLSFLARHVGDVVSKRQILDAVWDDDFEGDPNIVEVYLRQVRKADNTEWNLDPDADFKVLHNHIDN